jgi:hypothetical protein
MKRAMALILLLLLAACASKEPQTVQPPLDAWKSKIPYKPKELTVKQAAIVALMPPILFGRGGYGGPEAEIMREYTKDTNILMLRLPRPSPPVKVTSADIVIVDGPPGMPPYRVEREGLRGHYGYVLAEPGRRPKILEGTVGEERLVKEARKYFHLPKR